MRLALEASGHNQAKPQKQLKQVTRAGTDRITCHSSFKKWKGTNCLYLTVWCSVLLKQCGFVVEKVSDGVLSTFSESVRCFMSTQALSTASYTGVGSLKFEFSTFCKNRRISAEDKCLWRSFDDFESVWAAETCFFWTARLFYVYRNISDKNI